MSVYSNLPVQMATPVAVTTAPPALLPVATAPVVAMEAKSKTPLIIAGLVLLGAVGTIIYFYRKRQKDKEEEEKKAKAQADEDAKLWPIAQLPNARGRLALGTQTLGFASASVGLLGSEIGFREASSNVGGGSILLFTPTSVPYVYFLVVEGASPKALLALVDGSPTSKVQEPQPDPTGVEEAWKVEPHSSNTYQFALRNYVKGQYLGGTTTAPTYFRLLRVPP